ncbi:hypothetical protein K2P56_00640 [Patescibacteria group bacterium]|nr:hypothetical protein [Patescibacteria group bacterium]
MKKYIVLYHAPVGAMEKMANATPEDAQKGMEPWMQWAKKCGSALTDMGLPLGAAMSVTKGAVATAKTTVVGYSMLQAEDMEAATALLKGHPHVEWMDSCSVEVHEAMPLPGM